MVSCTVSNLDLLVDALSSKRGNKVEIIQPKRGERAELVFNAERNARESLARKMSESPRIMVSMRFILVFTHFATTGL